MYKGGLQNEPVVLQRGLWSQPKKDFIPRLRDHRGHGEEMQAKTVGQQTRNRNLVIPARASRSTFLCGLCALYGGFFDLTYSEVFYERGEVGN